jgi:biopolymer transport protein TolQ
MVDTSSGQVLAQSVEMVSKDLSLWGLFLHADIFVQMIILVLLAASFWCWSIIFSKMMQISKLQKLSKQFESTFWGGASLDDLYQKIQYKANDPLARMFVAVMQEWGDHTRHAEKHDMAAKQSFLDRVDRVLSSRIALEMEELEKHTGFLATVGSSAPFVGLLGTVWGIMHSFQAIAASKNTSLAVVAPGIAEALFATALGLVAAIPAVMAYNKISSSLNRYATSMETFSHELHTLVSRKLFGG